MISYVVLDRFENSGVTGLSGRRGSDRNDIQFLGTLVFLLRRRHKWQAPRESSLKPNVQGYPNLNWLECDVWVCLRGVNGTVVSSKADLACKCRRFEQTSAIHIDPRPLNFLVNMRQWLHHLSRLDTLVLQLCQSLSVFPDYKEPCRCNGYKSCTK